MHLAGNITAEFGQRLVHHQCYGSGSSGDFTPLIDPARYTL
jgi:hypothetical protein